MHVLSEDERKSTLSSVIQGEWNEIETARKISNRKSSYPTYIRSIKARQSELKPFIVADTETLFINDIHYAYAAGLMLVYPGREIKASWIDTYFSEDYIFYDSFEDRSTKVLSDLVLRIESLAKNAKTILTVYYHNLAKFDGILIVKHLAQHHKWFKIKPLMRKNMVYEIAVYSGNKMLFRFRDSLNLLPSGDTSYKSTPRSWSKRLYTYGVDNCRSF